MHETAISHDDLGAVAGDFQGRPAVLHYGDAAAEYRAVRTAAGLSDLSGRGKLRMTGADRQRFLHRVVTNDVEQLGAGDGVYACMLTPQGKIISDMTVHVRGEDLLIDVEPGMADVLRDTLDRYALMDDVEITDVTERYGLIGVSGRRADDCIHGLADPLPPLTPGGHAEIEWNGVPATVARTHRTGERDYDIYVPADSADEIWKALLAGEGDGVPCMPIGYETLEVLRVEAGIPRCTAELDDRIIPNEAVKDRAVSFTKGCYIGQEPVVMMEHRGRPNRLLSGMVVEGETLPGRNAVIRKDGKEAGWITTAVHGRAVDGIIALGFVRRRSMASGGPFEVEVDGAPARAEIADLPFYDPDP
ncbi:MAG: aminomethyl transferase family protein [Gemmatimonadetes bacterium]|nr:aminomethyl transferase family protein [Gemmatimonadota bacterium]MYG84955.1 aminomethyl transferase family protein [Gemmatimonadota bacterium]MYJ90503.1 aminomethyl transferase family protein [Gemmatimonadota bacterium]